MELPAAHFAEPLHQLSRVLMGQSIRGVTQLREAGDKLGPGLAAVAVFLGRFRKQFFADRFQLLAHFLIIFLLYARAPSIVKVFSGLDFSAAFFCNAW